MRRVRTILVLLLLGAVVNVAVAWGCVAGHAHPAPYRVAFYHDPYGGLWPVHEESCRGLQRVRICAVYPYDAQVHDYPRTPWWPSDLFAGSESTSVGVVAGWPALALAGWHRTDEKSGPRPIVSWAIAGRRGAPMPAGSHPRFVRPDPELYPFRPVVAGFLLNTICYAVLLLILFGGAGLVRSRIRSWRGRCVRCGYPRGESSTCSECGAAVKPLVTTTAMVERHALREKGPAA